MIETLLEEHPGILPEVIVSSRRYDLSRREADVVFRVVPFEEPGVVQCRLLQIDYGLYDRSGALPPIRGDGRDSRLILMDTSIHSYPEVAWLEAVLPRAQPVAVANNRSLQASLCQRGLGLAVLPRAVGDAMGGLTRIDLGEAPPARHIWMAYHEDMRGMGKVRALTAIASRLLGSGPEQT